MLKSDRGQHLNSQAESIIISVSNKAAIGGGVVAATSGAAEKTRIVDILGTYGTEIAAAGVLCGIFFGLVGLVIQLVFSIRRDRRESLRDEWDRKTERRHTD